MIKDNTLVVDARMINSSGIGTYLKNILPEIAKNFQLTLLGNKEELLLFDWTNECKIIEYNSKIYSLDEQIKFPFIVPKSELLWCPHFNAPFLPVKAKKIICTIHDLNHLAININHYSIKYLYAKMLYNNAVRKSNRLVTVSNFSKSELLKYTKAIDKKVKVIHCGVGDEFSNNNHSNDIIKLPDKYILFVGNVKPHKNLITLLKAYNNLPKEITDTYKLVILGRKDGFITPDKNIFNFMDSNDLWINVYFTGYIDDNKVPLIYKNAKLFVLPSIYEGFGLPILEAMASGIPVISSNSSSLKEIGGDASIYFDPYNSKKLQQKIELLIKDEKTRNKYVKKGINQIRMFSWKTSAIEHIKLFKKIINEAN